MFGTIYALVPKKEQGTGDHPRPYEVPCLTATVTVRRIVAEVPNNGRGQSISNLTNEDQEASVSIVYAEDEVVEEEEVGEPHRGTEVVEDVTSTVCQATSVGQVSRAGEVMGEAGEDGYWRSFC